MRSSRRQFFQVKARLRRLIYFFVHDSKTIKEVLFLSDWPPISLYILRRLSLWLCLRKYITKSGSHSSSIKTSLVVFVSWSKKIMRDVRPNKRAKNRRRDSLIYFLIYTKRQQTDKNKGANGYIRDLKRPLMRPAKT